MHTCTKRVAWHFWALVSLWSSATPIIFLADCWHLGRTIEEISLKEARACSNKDRALSPYMVHRRKEMAAHGVSFAVLWLLGVGGFWLAAAKLSQFMKKHDAVEEELKTSQARLKHAMADLVLNQESERKAIAQSLSAIKMNLEILPRRP